MEQNVSICLWLKRKKQRNDIVRQRKEKILAYVDEVNGSNGRGGPAAAKKKFGVSPITLTAWQKKRGTVKTAGRKTQKAKNPLKRMGEILDEIDAAEKTIKALQKEYTQLKKKI